MTHQLCSQFRFLLPKAELNNQLYYHNVTITIPAYLLPKSQTCDVLLRQHTDVLPIQLLTHRLSGQTLAAPVPVHPVKQASPLQTLTHTGQHHLTACPIHTHLKLRGLLKGGQLYNRVVQGVSIHSLTVIIFSKDTPAYDDVPPNKVYIRETQKQYFDSMSPVAFTLKTATQFFLMTLRFRSSAV